MAVLPVGTVTFLITDIEASTERWQRDEQEMSRALRVHDETLKALVAGHGGVVFKHTGDGICAAFSTVGEAAVTALEAQSSLDLPVRMGLHVGAVELRDDDYYGTTVNVTARVASLGCAGQIVVSDAIAVMLGDADLVDLGVHQLRGVSTPLRLFQLGPGAFPALSDAGSQPGNVPVELDEFIGRGAQLDELVVAVREDRVTTLLGVGGSGKTRLAIEAAHRLASRYRDGCWFVELSSAADDAGVCSAFAAGLGIRLGPVGDAHERIVSAMSSRQALVVVDNCEHVLDAAGRLIERIVRHCHGVNVLATSREPLMVSGERLTSVGALTEAEAVELFLVRAKDEAPNLRFDEQSLAAVGSICERLDRMPLAIELAASRTRAFSTAELAEMLDERFRLLVGGRRARVERHQTMRTTLDWSYELCSSDERIVFDSLSVFPTWFDLQAVRAVAADAAISGLDAVDLLARLVDRSLVEHDVGLDGASRYRLLETMRAYGREHLSHAGRSDDVRSRHANHVKAVMVVLAPQTAGPGERRAELIADRLVSDRYTAFAWFVEQHDWDGAHCVAAPLTAHDVRPEYEMLTALRDAIVASDDEPPSWFPWIDLFSDGFTHPHDELMRRAWEAFDRKPTWPADRWYMPGHLYLVGPNLCQRTTAELLATAECTNTHIAAMRHVAQVVVCHTLNAWGELELAEEHLDRWAPDWTASGSTRFRMYAPAIRATLNMVAGRFGEAARLFDEALHVQPLGEWHWSSYTLADRRLVARVRSGTPIASRDLVEPWQARQSSGLAFANSGAALITAYALDHLGASELADDFKQLLATTPPNVLADERRAMRIPDDYVLQPLTGEPQPLDDLLARLDEFAERINDQPTN